MNKNPLLLSLKSYVKPVWVMMYILFFIQVLSCKNNINT